MENDETALRITWGIYVKGFNRADLTEKERLCRRVARRILGLADEPVEVWQDTNSKRAADRPGRDAMLRAAHQGDFSILVTPAPHHISRDLVEYVHITRILIENKVSIHFADGTTQDCHETERPRYTLYRRVSSAAQGVDTKRPMSRDIRSQQAATHTRSGPFGYPNGPAKKVKTPAADPPDGKQWIDSPENRQGTQQGGNPDSGWEDVDSPGGETGPTGLVRHQDRQGRLQAGTGKAGASQEKAEHTVRLRPARNRGTR